MENLIFDLMDENEECPTEVHETGCENDLSEGTQEKSITSVGDARLDCETTAG